MNAFLAEIIGTGLLILLGNGVVANQVLNKTKGNDTGWILITLAWGLAVYVGVLVAGPYSGAHLNPAVTIGLAIAENDWANVIPYISAQCIGAAIGSILVVLSYKDHYLATDDLDGKLATFATAPAIRNTFSNIISEAIGTFVLMFGVFYITDPSFVAAGMEDVKIGLGSVGALPVALIVIAIGMSLGGSTGYAINPARDFIPRLCHSILPIGKKRDGDWAYAWIPIVGPLVGAATAAGLYLVIGS